VYCVISTIAPCEYQSSKGSISKVFYEVATQVALNSFRTPEKKSPTFISGSVEFMLTLPAKTVFAVEIVHTESVLYEMFVLGSV